MKVKPQGTPQIIMDNPMSRHNYFGWPTVARLKNGRIAVVSSGYRLAHVCPFGKAVMVFSENEGKTYTRPFAVIDTPLDDRDAGLCPFGSSGLIVTSFNNTVKFQRSEGNGGDYKHAYLDTLSTEDEAEYLGSTFRVSFDNGVTFGKLYKSPVSSPHGPIETSDKKIIYVGCRFDRHEGENRIGAYTINPNTGEMDFLGDVPNVFDEYSDIPTYEPYAIELPDGTLICHIRAERHEPGKTDFFATYQSVSVDGGKTWSYPECIADPHCGAPAHLLLHSSGTLISVVARRNEPWGIVAFSSKDNGKTWSEPQFIYEDFVSADLGYPATVELDDHSLQTVFYAHPDKDKPAVILAQNWQIDL